MYDADVDFMKAMATALSDYEVNQVSPLIALFQVSSSATIHVSLFLSQDLNERKHLPSLPELRHTLANAALYMETIQVTDSNSASSQSSWGTCFSYFDSFLKRLRNVSTGERCVCLSCTLVELLDLHASIFLCLTFSVSH